MLRKRNKNNVFSHGIYCKIDIEIFPGAKDIFIDRTERPIQRYKDEEKAQNKVICSIRVRVEHAIGGIKRMQITTDKFCNKSIIYI